MTPEEAGAAIAAESSTGIWTTVWTGSRLPAGSDRPRSPYLGRYLAVAGMTIKTAAFTPGCHRHFRLHQGYLGTCTRGLRVQSRGLFHEETIGWISYSRARSVTRVSSTPVLPGSLPCSVHESHHLLPSLSDLRVAMTGPTNSQHLLYSYSVSQWSLLHQ